MDDADSSSIIYFDVVHLNSKHWHVHVDGIRQPVPFTSRDSAAVAARAQARHFNLHSGLPTRVRVADVLGDLKCKNCYKELDNTLNDLPFEARRAVSYPEILASDTRLENDAANRHMDPVALSGTDMETSYFAPQSFPLDRPPLWRRVAASLLGASQRCRPLPPASRITTSKGVAS
ncbi:hypothetical protein J5226_03445 [Lysobacter sp. K5869]|uniref:hypothetical protein n=1 Tax=Lysobacter sp. K5869 TaxID=2820808 RepID=UPI001C06285E|nr:hypothetical protein [Lysobacter sp. K5869]QWP77472.1 hypothetical protein J5226_03445 [Lysobacter sp. K5869]